ncbi:DUF732 domain-containing protein [[Mycobacterium] nativiensis]|uniref:DUF732 domain-containing protein n=1 Tax=[Mycobacterium] nativiensis TaxID=2855503 RepID=A0ABU5XUK6_9MYCO|nr:DUF732 domain-containing protein [Mycolicibacter sp. MYC340]MEB3031392.1 DUF732 domain-containing protein [Mycolicibacter sp. MYC340]
MRFAAALLAALATVGFAGPVAADPSVDNASDVDTAFLSALQAAGVTYRRGDQAIVTARLVCQFIAQGKPSTEVLEGLKERNPGLSTEHGTVFVGIAAHTYCPDQLVQSGAPAAP